MILQRYLVQPVGWFLETTGYLAMYLWDVLQFILQGRIDFKKVLHEIASIGFDSFPVAMMISVIAGSVLALQTAERFAQTGADAYVGGLVALAIVREIAPIFTCLAVGARSGTAIAAEISNMQVSQQVAALQMMHVSPVRYLFVPKVIACVVSLPLLTILSATMGILGGMLVAFNVSHLHYSKYLDSVWINVLPYDIRIMIYKAAIFGILLAAICCTIGLRTRGGAKDVGQATTRAAVWTSIMIIIFDFFLTWIFFGTSWER